MPSTTGRDASVDALERTRLDRANALAGALTLLERKRLELARALATRPRLLLLDEIAGGLTEPEVHELWRRSTRSAREASPSSGSSTSCTPLLTAVDRLVALDAGRMLTRAIRRR